MLSGFLCVLYAAVMQAFTFFYSPTAGALTAQQLNDSVESYAFAMFVRDGGVQSVGIFALIFGLLTIWVWPRKNQMNPKTNMIGLLLLAGVLFTNTGCKPVKVLDVVEIKPNETAWAIPLDGASKDGQVKFNSVGFLDQKKVAAKRIMVDKVERSIGRMYWDIEWLPSTRVIRVDRSLVTRKWAGQQDIGVVTRDSVQLRVGLTITASIEEDEASKYLYYHGERALSDVIDQNVRSFAEAELTKEYSQLNLSEAQVKGTEIFNKLFEDSKAAFIPKGITIQYLGNAEGLGYSDPKVQEAINKSYSAQQDAKTAEMEQNAQKIRNQTAILTTTATARAEADAQQIRNTLKIQTSEAEATSAKNLLAARDATQFQNELKIKLLDAESKMAMATKWNGTMPANIIPSDSPLLMNLGAQK